MHLEASTNFTQQIFMDFNWFNFVKIRHFRIVVPTFLILYALILPIAFYLAIDIGDTVIYILSFALLFCVFYLILLLIIQPIKIFKTMIKQKPTAQHYIFQDDEFSAQAATSLSSGNTEHKYEALLKAFETDDYYFLYIGPATAYLVRKCDFTMGASKELRSKLREKLGKKFKERHQKK